jgi:diphthine-ammonia ligase
VKAAVLFSGGKDSAYALYKALETEEVSCLITIVSKNTESYMFHTPNISLADLQAQAMGLPLIKQETEGLKEDELKDLEKSLQKAVQEYGIKAVYTGAIESVYQASRIAAICERLNIACINPLWKKNQIELLNDIVDAGFEAIISGVFAYPLDDSWLGRKIDKKLISELAKLQEKYEINPAGEGGEIETTVLDAPYFKKRIEIIKSRKEYKNHSGNYIIEDAKLTEKK